MLWLTVLSVGPALALDLLNVGPDHGAAWGVAVALALVFGAPYYAAQTLLGAAARLPDVPNRGLDIAAALVVVSLGIAAHRWVVRRAGQLRAAAVDGAG